MEGPKLDKLKVAMKFVISKLGAMDRLSIVSFSSKAERLCELRSMTGASKDELIKDIIEGKLKASGLTNIRQGLETGLQVLADRRHRSCRVSSIVLKSDGVENVAIGASKVAIVGDVAVYTFGFGEDHDAEILTECFAETLFGLLRVVVQDLELTVWPQPGHSTIEDDDVVAGSYPKKPRVDGSGRRSISVSFGDLSSREVRKAIVHVCLPAVHREYRATALVARCSYRVQGQTFYSPSDGRLRCVIHRTRSAGRDAKKPYEVEEELIRIGYVEILEEVLTKGDTKILGKAQQFLDTKPPSRMIITLRNELQQLLTLSWKLLLVKLRELLTLHKRQRGGIFAPQPTAESSGWWAWAMVILCTVLATGIIVAGVAVFAVYTFFKPKMPYLVLGLLQYDQGGTIQSLQMSITILAENNNSKADAAFSRVDLALGFHGSDVALLRADPFVVARESSLPLRYNVVSGGRTLDPAGMQSMDESLRAGVVPLDLLGKARTRWKVGVFVKIRYWTRISCHLRFFFPGNGTVMPTDRDRCRSR
ncbi:hypothetical protein PVAP13_8KG061984 [Panicum virgatum]|uniref:VWFA domain-containing protein n=1 Tax=Panicum virgatum TaxID=38727 RepID=A0A8T0PQJ5_PANVG|nr:hypothetical protein PVAP13_8KG061984 [Panicum virgatum]